VNAPTAQAPRHPSPVDADGSTGLTALLELFSAEEPATGTPPATRLSPRPSLRASGARVLAWTRTSSSRAASWCARSEGAGRAC